MEKFKRHFYKDSERKERIESLQNEAGFAFIKKDVLAGDVFPTLRENAVDFYFMGARLSRYKSSRMTWHKDTPQPNTESDYENIKKKCVSWGQKNNGTLNERATLSHLYKKYSPYISPNPAQSQLVILDIEVGFPRLEKDGQIFQNVQVDLLFLDLATGTLYFVESKDADDGRIKVTPSKNEQESALYNRLEVASQIEKYRANLSVREQEITEAYLNYVNIMEEIFECSIYSEKQLTLYPHPKLFVYGKPTQNGEVCMNAIRSELGKDLIFKDEASAVTDSDILA